MHDAVLLVSAWREVEHDHGVEEEYSAEHVGRGEGFTVRVAASTTAVRRRAAAYRRESF